MKINKQNWPIIIAFGAPILMIAIVVAVIYLPSRFSHPKYNFIYALSTGPYYGKAYNVDAGGKITQLPAQIPASPTPNYIVQQPQAKLYLYNISNDASTELSVSEANKYQLSPMEQSPDGYSIGYGQRAEGLFPLFIGSSVDYSQRYIQGHGVNHKLSINNNNAPYFYGEFQFIGWVTGNK